MLLLLFISFSSVYFINTMGIVINKQIIKNIFASNSDELYELLSTQTVLYSLSIIICIYFIYTYLIRNMRILLPKVYFFSMFITILLYLAIMNINTPLYKDILRRKTSQIVPLSVLKASANYIRTKSREETIQKRNISEQFKLSRTKKEPLISILVIGESARADHFSLNGYSIKTTPLLEQIPNIISFKKATSCDTSTLSSVPCLLSRAIHENFSFPLQETSFVQIFKDHGFDTHWLTLQNEAKVIHTFCEEASECFDASSLKYDREILPKIKQIIQTYTKDTLIVIHTMGSHQDYNQRVPKEYKIFQPLCLDAYETCTQTSLHNSYDNTIYTTDIFLTSLVKLLEHKNAFMLYTSDHGESLGESSFGFIKRYGHASPYNIAPDSQTHIPFILWFSPTYNALYHINTSFNTLKPISHDYIFYTMLGCAHFKGETLYEQYNLCHEYKKR